MIRKKVICGLILTICIFVVCLVGCAPKKFNAFRNSIIKFGDYSSKNHQYEVVLKNAQCPSTIYYNEKNGCIGTYFGFEEDGFQVNIDLYINDSYQISWEMDFNSYLISGGVNKANNLSSTNFIYINNYSSLPDVYKGTAKSMAYYAVCLGVVILDFYMTEFFVGYNMKDLGVNE